MRKQHDIIVVGGGSGGLAAAHAARFRGASVAIVNDGPIGGDCTWTGCVPSKALLAAAASGLGFDAAMKAVRHAVLTIAGAEDAPTLRSHGIDVIEGRGTLRGPGCVVVDGEEHHAGSVILSPGSAPFVPPITGIDTVDVFTNEQVFDLAVMPTHLVIIGGGPIGCEMSEAFVQLGARVTIVEGEDRILPRDDVDAAAVVHGSLERRGVDIRTGAMVSAVAKTSSGVRVDVSGGSSIEGSHLLVATGRAPSHASVGLEEAGVVLTNRGWIDVDETLKTSVDGVYAIGDAIGGAQFTHAAAHMGRLAVENAIRAGFAKFRKHRYDPTEIPWVTFTSPEVAQVGMTESEARFVKGAKVAEIPLSDVDRAVAVGRSDGFVKLIAAPRTGLGMAGGGRLIGATIVADRAGEMASEVALAIRTKMFAGRLAQTVHPYPSWSMALQMAAALFVGDYGGRSVRRPR